MIETVHFVMLILPQFKKLKYENNRRKISIALHIVVVIVWIKGDNVFHDVPGAGHVSASQINWRC